MKKPFFLVHLHQPYTLTPENPGTITEYCANVQTRTADFALLLEQFSSGIYAMSSNGVVAFLESKGIG